MLNTKAPSLKIVTLAADMTINEIVADAARISLSENLASDVSFVIFATSKTSESTSEK